jgi:predicted GIY-YIG superfamily endonuclease
MELYFVYILKCADDSYYIGHTNDIERRLVEHKTGLYVGYTVVRLPAYLVYFKDFTCRDAAFTFERQIKKWSRKKKEALIEGNLEALRLYAKRKN